MDEIKERLIAILKEQLERADLTCEEIKTLCCAYNELMREEFARIMAGSIGQGALTKGATGSDMASASSKDYNNLTTAHNDR